jgi:mannan endo-1,4-beta-mannosidase
MSLTPPPGADEWAVVERRGPHLWASERPFIVHGFNTYWLVYLAADPAARPAVTAAFAEAAGAGLNVCRTWAFNDGGYRALQLKPFSYDEVSDRSLRCAPHGSTHTCLTKCVA